MSNPPNILIAAGGTGGHLIPAQQLGSLLEEKTKAIVTFAGYKLENNPYFERGRFSFFEITSSARLSNVWELAKGFFQAIEMLRKVKPEVVVGFGSYHSAPVLLASLFLRKKIVLYEANRQMGKVNRWFSFAAKAIGVQFPLIDCKSSKLVSVKWFPWVRKEASLWSREKALSAYGLDEKKMTVLVFGGSQGAQFLNETAASALKSVQNVQVIHIAGSEAGVSVATKRYKEENVRAVVKTFETDMVKAYAAANFALCRSGAGTIAELVRFSVPSLLIPYPYAAEKHQEQNAMFLSDCGGAFVLAQDEANEEAIAKKIKEADLEGMREALQNMASRNEASLEFYQLVSQMCCKKK